MKYILIIIIALLQITDTYSSENNQKIDKLVVDNANVFSAEETQYLEDKLIAFNDSTSTQILVYTTNDLQGYDIGDFAQRLGQSIGVGQKGLDNGIVIVFKPKNGNEKGRVTIQTGYGIEPLIPDITANQIINNEMIPLFKQGKIFEGINNAVDICISLTKKEFTAQQYNKQTSNNDSGGAIFFIVFIIVTISIFRARNNTHTISGGKRKGSSIPFWLLLFMGSGSSGSNRGSGWNDFSSGSGGFGGFGGGGFGGGGASGSW